MAPAFASLFEDLDKVRDILASDGRTLPQGALAWVWARSKRSIPIPGFRTFDQVKENRAALSFGPLAADNMLLIDRVLERPPTLQP